MAHRPDEAFVRFAADFTTVEAAGGIVVDSVGRWLMIHRNGRWDLPKGHIEEGESCEICAAREIAEETGVCAEVVRPLCATWHAYWFPKTSRWELKRTHWFELRADDCDGLAPQTEEGIERVTWVASSETSALLADSFPTIRCVAAAMTQRCWTKPLRVYRMPPISIAVPRSLPVRCLRRFCRGRSVTCCPPSSSASCSVRCAVLAGCGCRRARPPATESRMRNRRGRLRRRPRFLPALPLYVLPCVVLWKILWLWTSSGLRWLPTLRLCRPARALGCRSGWRLRRSVPPAGGFVVVWRCIPAWFSDYQSDSVSGAAQKRAVSVVQTIDASVQKLSNPGGSSSMRRPS